MPWLLHWPVGDMAVTDAVTKEWVNANASLYNVDRGNGW